jgi:hypothetical protein
LVGWRPKHTKFVGRLEKTPKLNKCYVTSRSKFYKSFLFFTIYQEQHV